MMAPTALAPPTDTLRSPMVGENNICVAAELEYCLVGGVGAIAQILDFGSYP